MIPKPIQYCGFYSTETEIIASLMQKGARKFYKRRVTFCCKCIENGTAGETEAEHFCDFIIRLTGRIVQRFTKQLFLEWRFHHGKLCVSSGNDQAKKRILWFRIFNKIRIDMRLHVIDADIGNL